MIADCINKAYEFALAQQETDDCGCSDTDADINNVNIFVNLIVKFCIGLIGIFILTAIKSGVHGLGAGLVGGLCRGNLLDGITGAVQGAVSGLAKGSTTGFGDFLNALFSNN